MTERDAGRGRLHSASQHDIVTFAQLASNGYGGTVAGSGLTSHSPNERDYIVEVPPPPNTGVAGTLDDAEVKANPFSMRTDAADPATIVESDFICLFL